MNSILKNTSFATLDADGQNAVRRLFDKYYIPGKKFEWTTLELSRNRISLSSSINLYMTRLTNLNPASFRFLNESQRAALEEELLFTFYVLSAQCQLDEIEHRRQKHIQRILQIWQCAQFIQTLRAQAQKETPETILSNAIEESSDKLLKYLGLTILGPFVAEKINQFSSGKTRVIKNWLAEINAQRLIWVWNGGLFTSILSMLPDNFARKQQAEKALAAPAPVLDYASWILYYTKFGINLSLLLKHTFAGPWMSEEERKIPAWERFKTQWQYRKFSILNDSVWATVNLVTFFWLTGKGMLGYWGNVLTGGLLLFDLSLNIWQFCEESTRYNQEMLRYKQDIEALTNKIRKFKKTNPEKAQIIQEHLDSLERAQKQLELDWKYKKYGLINNLVYSIGLIAAFSVLCSFYFPPALLLPATAMILGVVGSALLFALTVAYATVTASIEIAKSQAKGKSARKECGDLLVKFKGSEDDSEKKLLYLEMQQLMANSDYQKRLVNFQKMKMVRAILIDAMLPFLIFTAFLFMPLGVGIAVLAAGFALASLSQVILKRFEPKADVLPDFDEDAYEQFKTELNLDGLTSKKPGFFGNRPKQTKTKPVMDTDKTVPGKTTLSSNGATG